MLSLLEEHGILHSQGVSTLLKGPPVKPNKKSKKMKPTERTCQEVEMWRIINYLRNLSHPIFDDSDDDEPSLTTKEEEIETTKEEEIETTKEEKIETTKEEVIEEEDNYAFDSDDCGMDSDDFQGLDE